MKKYFKLLMLLIGCAIIVGCATIQNSAEEEQFVNIPGGLNKNDVSKLMKEAKIKCYDLGYKIINEDKETGHIVAEKTVNDSTWTLITQINENGFIVKHNANDVTSYLNPYFSKWKEELKNKLLESAEKK